jgi:hypothetical protein
VCTKVRIFQVTNLKKNRESKSSRGGISFVLRLWWGEIYLVGIKIPHSHWIKERSTIVKTPSPSDFIALIVFKLLL